MRVNKIICDKCGQEVPYKDVIEVEMRHKTELIDEYDLCPLCQDLLCNWIMLHDNS